MKYYNQELNLSKETWSEILSNDEVTDAATMQILKCIFDFEKFEASGGEIAKKLNYSHHAPLNIIIPNFSKKILSFYSNTIPPLRPDGKIRYWHIPFLGSEGNGKFIWILRPELAEAMEKKFGQKETEERIAEEIDEKEFFEGHCKQIFVNKYERDPKARKACLDHFGYACQVCGFDFEKVYGPIGRGIIHVHHHKNKISASKKECKINPLKDLIPVCPNCHTMIHSRREMLIIDEVKALLIK